MASNRKRRKKNRLKQKSARLSEKLRAGKRRKFRRSYASANTNTDANVKEKASPPNLLEIGDTPKWPPIGVGMKVICALALWDLAMLILASLGAAQHWV